jgi:micrococcal nuclease
MPVGVLLLAVALSGCAAIDTAQPGPLAQLEVGNHPAAGPAGLPVTVTRVIDGDTVHVTDPHGNRLKVRLLGIDSSETHDPQTPVQCWRPEASRFATATLLHQRVRLVGDPTQDARDRFGRTLAYLYLPNGDNYSVLAAARGAARSYVYDHRPVTEHLAITAAETDARAAGRGLWVPAPPDPAPGVGLRPGIRVAVGPSPTRCARVRVKSTPRARPGHAGQASQLIQPRCRPLRSAGSVWLRSSMSPSWSVVDVIDARKGATGIASGKSPIPDPTGRRDQSGGEQRAARPRAA